MCIAKRWGKAKLETTTEKTTEAVYRVPRFLTQKLMELNTESCNWILKYISDVHKEILGSILCKFYVNLENIK